MQIRIVRAVIMVEIDDRRDMQHRKKQEINSPVEPGWGFKPAQSAQKSDHIVSMFWGSLLLFPNGNKAARHLVGQQLRQGTVPFLQDFDLLGKKGEGKDILDKIGLAEPH